MSASSTPPVGYTLKGTLFHTNGDRVQKQHFHLYNTEQKYIGHGKTGDDGRFYVHVRTPASLDQKISLVFRLCREHKLVEEHPKLGKDKELCDNLSFYRGRKELAETVETFVLDKLEKDLGEVHFEKPYEKEQVPLSYYIDLAKAAVPPRLTAMAETAKVSLDFFGWHTVGSIVNNFGVKKTPLTCENTWKIITNGICPIYFKEEEEHLTAEVNWDRYEFDKLQSLPNVKVWFKEQKDKDPVLVRIDVQFREVLPPSDQSSDKGSVRSYYPEDKNIQEGLRIANSVFHVFGQTAYHLAIGHVYGSNAAIAAYDYLPGHPLGELLLPHCQFIRKISEELGRPTIFGDDGVLNVSALSVNGIAHLISDTLAGLDPFSFKPREPMSDHHTFAKAQNHHYQILQEAVKEYFDLHWDEMTKDWEPVHGFFRRMFKRSPLFRPWGGEDVNTAKWRDANEIGGHAEGLPPRMKYKEQDPEVRSFRFIAQDVNGPSEGDRELIEKFVVDFIHHVTLWHSWLHRSQYVSTEASPSIADVNFAPISLEKYGQKPFGGIKKEDAIHELRIISTFKGFPTGNYRLLDSKEAYPGIVKRVNAASEGYIANGIKPQEIQVSTVI